MKNSLVIIGAGKVGKTLGRLWTLHGPLQVQAVCNRSTSSAQTAVDFIGCGQALADYALLPKLAQCLIATPDDQIAATCTALAEAGKFSKDSIVFHCSGALPASVMQSASACGAAIASLHPIRSFAQPEKVIENFTGTWCGAEGDDRALDLLIPAFTAIGAHAVPIKSEAKIHYHAGAVFASNYLVTLLDIAVQSYERAGIAPEIALQMMAPLARESVENVFKIGPEAALTGPIARGDMQTAKLQQEAVAVANPLHGALYEQFIGLTAELAARNTSRPK